MNNSASVRIGQCPCCFLKKARCICCRHWARAVDAGSERLAIDIAHDEAENSFSLFDCMNRHDVRVRERCSGARLLKKSRAQIFAHCHFRRQKLDSDWTVQANITREIHCAHSASAQLFFEYVVRSQCVASLLLRDHGLSWLCHLLLLQLHCPDVALAIAYREIKIFRVSVEVRSIELMTRISKVDYSTPLVTIDRQLPDRR